MVSRYEGAENVTQYSPSVAKALWGADDVSAVFEGIATSAGDALRNGADETWDDGEEASWVSSEVEVLITRYAVDVR